MKKEVLKKLRNQFGIDKKQFSDIIGLTLEDYECFSKNPENMPAQVVITIKSIMLEQEQINLKNYYDKFADQKSAIFTSNKIFAHHDKLSQYFDPEEKKKMGPITVEMHPSTYCNHSCPGCIYGVRNLSPCQKHNFDMKLLPELIEDMKELGVKGVNLSGGGEPLMHPNCDSIIKQLKKAGFDVGLITNGALLDKPADIENVLDNCLWVRFSVDAGSDEVYKETHGHVADFDKTVDIIKNVVGTRNMNKPVFHIKNVTDICYFQ
jgi:hypothetical protein